MQLQVSVLVLAATALASPASLSLRQNNYIYINGTSGTVQVTTDTDDAQNLGCLDSKAQFTADASACATFTATNGQISVNGQSIGLDVTSGIMEMTTADPILFYSDDRTSPIRMYYSDLGFTWYASEVPAAGSTTDLFRYNPTSRDIVVQLFLTY
ncbi:hypothetical protein BGW36DRAFT_423327 [Talaromyces proteolyticus]|uniref:Uncharacterized protein n=1 Tax=Talaromyces proteolyticus TaxID=1131652 RepID=A0AAD4L380_9EURO|nr:uncharacterized protein BGW36DRAFT_423327 [Talaromyces proteolyticus]KAH8703779.1 hypothetical protein BGW36DRAFT_423327 [Talaromyces proteolyticus]